MSSLGISSGGRPLEQRSCPTTTPSFVDVIHDPQILTNRRGRQHSASGVSPRNRHAMQTAAERRQKTHRNSVHR